MKELIAPQYVGFDFSKMKTEEEKAEYLYKNSGILIANNLAAICQRLDIMTQQLQDIINKDKTKFMIDPNSLRAD